MAYSIVCPQCGNPQFHLPDILDAIDNARRESVTAHGELRASVAACTSVLFHLHKHRCAMSGDKILKFVDIAMRMLAARAPTDRAALTLQASELVFGKKFSASADPRKVKRNIVRANKRKISP